MKEKEVKIISKKTEKNTEKSLKNGTKV